MYRLISFAGNAFSSVIVQTTSALVCFVALLLLHAQTPPDGVSALVKFQLCYQRIVLD
jgi:hypothetical protein